MTTSDERRKGLGLDAFTIALFGLLALVFVQFAPFTGAMVGAVDITTRQTSPYMEDQAEFQRSENPLQTDQVDGIALAATFWSGIKSGEIRMWESNLGTGVPLGGVTYTRVWSPFYWIGAIVPSASLSAYAVWLALWSAQSGAWFLARRLGMGRAGAILTGVAYGFSGPSTALLLRINEIAMAPWVIAATHGAVTARPRRSVAAICLLALSVTMLWLGGFPTGSVFTIYGAGAIALGVALVDVGPKIREVAAKLAPVAAGIAAGTLLAAPLLLPSFEFLSASESLDRSYSSDHVAGMEMFGSAISGRILGTYPEGTWWWPIPGYSNPVSASTTVGGVVLILLLFGALATRRTRPQQHAARIVGRVYLPLGAVVFIGTFVGGPILAALQMLPFLRSNEFGRSRFLLSLALALAAGLVLDGLVKPSSESRTLGRTFRLLAAGAVAAAAWGSYLIVQEATELGFLDRAMDGLVIPLISLSVAAIAVAVITLLTRSKGWLVLSVAVLVIALAAELQWGAWEFTPVVDPDEGFFPAHPAFEVMEPAVSDGSYRFAGTAINVIRPNSSAWLDISDLRVSNPSYVGYRELMRAIDPGVFDRARLRTWFTDDLDPSSPGLDRSSVKYLVSPASTRPLESETAEEVEIDGTGALRVAADTTPVRGLQFDFEGRCRDGFVTVRASKDVVGQRPLWQIREDPFTVAIEDVSGPETLEVSLQTNCDLALPDTVGLLRAREDTSLQVLRSDDAVTYLRANALPRFHLATSVREIADKDARLSFLVDAPATETVLESLDSTPVEPFDGSVELVEDTGDRLELSVSTQGPGVLIVRDANAPGWRATVDGEPATILAADHAYRAVNVPAGDSIVIMEYQPPSRLLGIGFGGVTLVALILAFEIERRTRTGKAPTDRKPARSPD